MEQLCDVVHDTYACPSFVLPLAEVEERNYGGFPVLWWVTRDDFLSALEVLGVEFKGNLRSMSLLVHIYAPLKYLGVVVCGIPVLEHNREHDASVVCVRTYDEQRVRLAGGGGADPACAAQSPRCLELSGKTGGEHPCGRRGGRILASVKARIVRKRWLCLPRGNYPL